MMQLTKRVISNVKTLLQGVPINQLYVAYSAGLDSQVLLDCLRQDETLMKHLRAIHINHGLAEQADEWQEHCREYCDKYSIPFICKSVLIETSRGKSPEANFRQVRYEAIAQLCKKNDVVCTGHHQDDQVETFFIQSLRGSGVKGMAAMPVKKSFAEGYLLRPLLELDRVALQAYAELRNLHWCEDVSNQDLGYDRNFLRHQVIPIIKQRWSRMTKTIARAASHCAQADALLTALAKQDYNKVKTADCYRLSCSKLLALTKTRAFNVLRYWFTHQKMAMPNATLLKLIWNNIINAKQDANPFIEVDKYCLRRYANNLYLCRNVIVNIPRQCITWDLKSILQLPEDMGKLFAVECSGRGLSKAKVMQLGQINIRFRCGGERLRPKRRIGSHPLKKLFQEWQIPPWLRQSIPLLYAGDILLAVIGYAIADDYAASEEEIGFVIEHKRQ